MNDVDESSKDTILRKTDIHLIAKRKKDLQI